MMLPARDADGFLLNMNDWTPELAEQLAAAESLKLQPQHWLIIEFVRQFYQRYQQSPAIRPLVKALKDAYGPDIGNSIYLQELFPAGPALQVSRLSGLPRPRRCL